MFFQPSRQSIGCLFSFLIHYEMPSFTPSDLGELMLASDRQIIPDPFHIEALAKMGRGEREHRNLENSFGWLGWVNALLAIVL